MAVFGGAIGDDTKVSILRGVPSSGDSSRSKTEDSGCLEGVVMERAYMYETVSTLYLVSSEPSGYGMKVCLLTGVPLLLIRDDRRRGVAIVPERPVRITPNMLSCSQRL